MVRMINLEEKRRQAGKERGRRPSPIEGFVKVAQSGWHALTATGL
jgi:hypothetical protein